MRILENKYGLIGYAFWFKLLELLGKTENHYICFQNRRDKLVFESKIGLELERCLEILDLLASLDAIDSELWKQGEIIYSRNLVERLLPVYQRRGRDLPEKPFPNQKPGSGGVSGSETGDTDSITGVSESENPQSKVKKSKVKKSKDKGRARGRAREGGPDGPPAARVDSKLADRFFEIIDRFPWDVVEEEDREWFVEKVEKNNHYSGLNLWEELEAWENWLEKELRKKTSRQRSYFPSNFKQSLHNFLKKSIQYKAEKLSRPKDERQKSSKRVQCACGYVFDLFFQGQECGGCGRPYHSQGAKPNEDTSATGEAGELVDQVSQRIGGADGQRVHKAHRGHEP